MLPFPSILLPLLLLALVPEAARAQCREEQAMACGRVSVAEVKEIYEHMLSVSGYDNTLDDQKPYDKPRRRKTTAVYLDLVALSGSPAAAVAANTGVNSKASNPKGHAASHVLIDAPAVAQFAQNRAQVAWLMGHEIAHLAMHHPEEQEKKMLEEFTSWFERVGGWYQAASNERIRDAFLKERQGVIDRFILDQETAADLEADAYVAEIVDPKTGRRFGEDAGREFLDSVKQWLKARGEKTGDEHHGTLDERIERLAHAQSLREGRRRVDAVLPAQP